MKKAVFDKDYPIDGCHAQLLQRTPVLSYDGTDGYKEKLGAKLRELLGDEPTKVDPNVAVLSKTDCGSHVTTYFTFDSEKGVTVPAYLLVPKGVIRPPVVICLQGHSTGMHISVGEAKFRGDKKLIGSGDRDFAVHALNNGYAALVLEQRCFGMRESKEKSDNHTGRCTFASMTALLVGRTMIGERVWDVSRAIDVLEGLSEVDGSRVACMGNSGGGTVTYYAAAMDERIKIAMPSCSVCTYAESIGAMRHCVCNYIPGAAKYFDMGDLAALIAPRRLVVVAGAKDSIFPISGVKTSFEKIKRIYDDCGAVDGCELFVGGGGHRFYKDAYRVFNAFAKKLNW